MYAAIGSGPAATDGIADDGAADDPKPSDKEPEANAVDGGCST